MTVDETRTRTAGSEETMEWSRRELAGFWLRVAALGVDLVVVVAAAALLAGLVVPALVGVVADLPLPGTVDEAALTLWLLVGLGVLVLVLYDVLATAGAGGTLGKRAAGIEVRDQASGQRVEAGVAAGRMITRVLSLLPVTLGFLWAGWSARKQTWHDLLAGTVVVRRRHLPAELRWPEVGAASALPMLALGRSSSELAPAPIEAAPTASPDPDAEPAEAEPADDEPAEAELADADPADAELAEAEPTDAELAEAELAEAELAEAEASEPRGAEPPDAEPGDPDSHEPADPELAEAEHRESAVSESEGQQPTDTLSSALDEVLAEADARPDDAEPEPAPEPEPEPAVAPEPEPALAPEPEPEPAPEPAGQPADPNLVAIQRAELAAESAGWLEQVAEQVDPRLDAVTPHWRDAPQAPAARACAFGLLIGYLASMYPHMQQDLDRAAEAHPSFTTLPEGQRLATLQSIAADPRRAAAWLGPLIDAEDPDQMARLLE